MTVRRLPQRRPKRAQRLAVAALSAAGLLAAAPTAQAICTGGGHGLEVPSTLTFPTTQLNGLGQTITTSMNIVAHDRSGTGNGWKVTGTSTTLTSGGNQLPTSATRITGATITAGSGNCTVRPNNISYPVTLPAGNTPPTALRLANATNGSFSGTGPTNIALAIAIDIPGNARVGTYTSTWTLTIASGPS